MTRTNSVTYTAAKPRPVRGERFPLQPLLRAANADSIVALARTLGVASRTVHRWAATGIPSSAADRAAIAIGSHPANLWPRQWNALPEDLSSCSSIDHSETQ